ncbi:hypothetical protein [Cuspidothrix issatschenkoi]|uniref:hypothetical protein n=1 Tax=Cuspidothrix issatschenkoi TaxID=230752 RepID=UPI001A9C9D7B|nr:hypothetical protein [Cuspidothrix issatschenkoi]
MASCPAESTVVDFFRPLLLRLTSRRQALSFVPEVKPSASLRLKTCTKRGRSIRSPSSLRFIVSLPSSNKIAAKY